MGAARARGSYLERKLRPLGPQLNHKVDAPLGRYIHRTENKFEVADREAREKARIDQVKKAAAKLAETVKAS